MLRHTDLVPYDYVLADRLGLPPRLVLAMHTHPELIGWRLFDEWRAAEQDKANRQKTAAKNVKDLRSMPRMGGS